jgi:glycolate oxidase FAD binding subunit
MTENLNYLSQQLAAATADKKTVRIRGGGTKDWYGQALQGEILDTRTYAGIISYDPTELVITVRCGTRLTDLEANTAL